MSLYEEERPHTTKETITCEKCLHPNIVKIKNVEQRKKRDHMLYTDDHTWSLFKAEASAFDQSLGDFLRFMIAYYRSHRESFNVPIVPEVSDV